MGPHESVAKRLFSWVSRLLPFDFRREYGREMELAFASDLDDPKQAVRPTRVWSVWARAVAGLGPVAVREHVAVTRQDVGYAVRMLAKQPGFTATALLSLSLGIGATTAVFSLVDGLFLQPLPVAADDRLVGLYTIDKRNPGFNPTSFPNYLDYRDGVRAFSSLTAYTFTPLNVSSGGEPQQVLASLVAGNYFEVLGVRAALGRVLDVGDARVDGQAPVAVLSHGYWTRRFAANPRIIGDTIRVNGTPCTVIGVTPPTFTGTDIGPRIDLWVPLSAHGRLTPDLPEILTERRLLQFAMIGRLAPGRSLAQAQSEAQAVAARLEHSDPEANRDRTVQVMSLRVAVVDPNLRPMLVAASSIMAVIVVLVLVIACANVASLLLGRATARRTEIALRVALGAGRLRLVRQFLTEQLVLSGAGAVLGVALGAAAWRILWAVRPTGTLPVIELPTDLDTRVLVFSLFVAVATAFLFGLAPLLHLVRSAPVQDLRDRGTDTRVRQSGLRNVLLAAEVALAIVALVTAGLFLHSFDHARRISPGIAAGELVVATVDLAAQGYSPERATEFERAARARIERLPQVRKVSWSTLLPLVTGGFGRTVFLEGDHPPPGGNGQFVTTNAIEPEYLDTMGVRLVSGRPFQASDRADAPAIAIVNQAMARRFWPQGDPLGRRFHFFGERTTLVVGVAADSKVDKLGEDPVPIAYVPLTQWPARAATLNVRVAGDPTALVEPVRRELRALDPALPLTNLGTMSGHVTTALWTPRAGAFVLSAFGAIALALALIGLYGVLAYSVALRRRELAIRLALGAAEGQIVAMLAKEILRVVIPALAVGMIAAVLVSRYTSGILYDVAALDSPTLVLVPTLFLFTACLAAYWPVRRATRVDPTIALRQ